MVNARAREVARDMASGARRVADAVRDDMQQTEAGKLNDGITCLVEAITSLALAVERLADVSEQQDADLDELREQVGAA
jgi:hypothetical protein